MTVPGAVLCSASRLTWVNLAVVVATGVVSPAVGSGLAAGLFFLSGGLLRSARTLAALRCAGSRSIAP